MGKFYFLIYLGIFFSSEVFAGKAMVLVHQTPLFSQRSIHSVIKGYVKKGDTIYIHDGDIGPAPTTPIFEMGENGKLATKRIDSGSLESLDKDFYESMDHLGQPVYILGKHIKLILNDDREYQTKIHPFDFDPTDYRLKEPLRKGYPVSKEIQNRVGFALGLGSQPKIHYPYPNAILEEDYDLNKSFQFHWYNLVDWNVDARFYYGVNFHLFNLERRFVLGNSIETTEKGGQIGFGPSLSWDTFRSDSLRLTYTLSLTPVWERYTVSQTSQNTGISDDRIFEGFSVMPKVSGILQRPNFFPGVDFYVQAEGMFQMAHSLKAISDYEVNSYWDTDGLDQIEIPTSAAFVLSIGIQSSF